MNLRFCPNLSMLFSEVPFLDRFEQAAKAGFAAVEFLFPYEEGIDEIRSRLDQYDLAAVLFDVPLGDPDAGEVGTLCCPGRRDYFRQGFEMALDAARRLSCNRINVLLGNRDPGLDLASQVDCAVENLLWAAPQAQDAGVTLLLEPLSWKVAPKYLLSRSNDVVDLVRAVDHPRVRLQYDVYHAQIVEGNLIDTITEHFDLIEHIQIGDVPGRHEPGTGEINYPAIFAALEGLGYQGYIGLEYTPLRGTIESLDWLPIESRKLA